MNIIGLDACKYGWCGVGRINNRLFWGCFSGLEEVVNQYPMINRILIDIPIGLSSENYKRTVDAKARTLLDHRKSSIFSPPCREACNAENYKDALALNRKIEGKGISVQAYNISSKIKETDLWVNQKSSNIQIFEAHPELCFKTLNNTKDLDYSKHSKEGIDQRKNIIFSHDEALKSVFENLMADFKRSQVKRDDILDAMALYLINKNSEKLKTISDENSIDETGKKVRIVYG
jgi:predicted RNase H-like nuclease